jgi:carbon storage regulator
VQSNYFFIGMNQEDIPMLIITRKLGQRFVIGNSITVTVLQVDKGKVRLGIDAPSEFKILREELQKSSMGWRPSVSVQVKRLKTSQDLTGVGASLSTDKPVERIGCQ